MWSDEQPRSSRRRRPVQQLLPPVPPAPADAAGETPLPGSAAAEPCRSRAGAARALLRGLPPLWDGCVGAALQRVSGTTSPVAVHRNRLCLRGNSDLRFTVFNLHNLWFTYCFVVGDSEPSFLVMDEFLIPRCPNPLDPAPQQDVVSAPLSQTRRFTVSTFQFLPDGEFKDPDEEVRTTHSWTDAVSSIPFETLAVTHRSTSCVRLKSAHHVTARVSRAALASEGKERVRVTHTHSE